MDAETWRRFANQAGLWLLTVFAAYGALFYAGFAMPSLPMALLTVAIGWVGTWVALRINPTYYDRNRATREQRTN